MTEVAEALGRPRIDLLGQPYEGPRGRPDLSVKSGSLLIAAELPASAPEERDPPVPPPPRLR